MQSQLQNHPDELWEDGVKDYLSHASNIMVTFIIFSFCFESHVFNRCGYIFFLIAIVKSNS